MGAQLEVRMIVVSDNQGDRVEVGETRRDLEDFLLERCSDDYADLVIAWFDSGSRTFQLDNGLEGIIDTWTNSSVDDGDEDEDEDEDEDQEYDDGYGHDTDEDADLVLAESVG